MGKKYIIELEEPEMFDDRKFYTCSQMPWWAVSENIVENLTPYTEPDTEKVREEAYEDGYKTAKVQCNIQAEKDLREVGERHYQKGLSDAWGAARKIAVSVPLGGMSQLAIKRMFGVEWQYVLMNCTPATVIEKLKKYQKQEEQIQVGDEVEFYNGEKSVVLVVEDGKPVKLLEADGYTTTADGDLLSSMKKTGRHFPEIAEVLEKMKEKS